MKFLLTCANVHNLGILEARDRYDYLEEEYVDLDINDSQYKPSTKDALKATSKEENFKVAKTSHSFTKHKNKIEEGSGGHFLDMLNDDEDSDSNDEESREGSGEDDAKLSYSEKSKNRLNEVGNHVKKGGANFGKLALLISYQLKYKCFTSNI